MFGLLKKCLKSYSDPNKAGFFFGNVLSKSGKKLNTQCRQDSSVTAKSSPIFWNNSDEAYLGSLEKSIAI